MRKTTAAAQASLSAVAAVALAASLCAPIVMWGVDKAVAEEATTGDAVAVSQGVQTLSCTGDGDEYSTIAEAIEAGATEIVLTGNVTESVTIPAGKTVTLDLAGYTLTNVDGSHTITVSSGATLTITDSVGGGVVDNVTHARAALFNDVGGVVVLEGGTFNRSQENGTSAENAGGNSFYTIQNYGTMTIEEGTTVRQGSSSEVGKYSSLIENGWYTGSQNTSGAAATLTINGGSFIGGLNTIKNDDWGVLTINDGSFTNTAQAAVLNWNVATINGGTFQSDEYIVLNGELDPTMDKGELTMTGGSFTGGQGFKPVVQMGGSNSIGSVSISGGTFSEVPDEEFLADGYVLLENADGTYTAHQHDLVEHPAKAATCTEDGNVDYWFCALCGNYYLSADSEKPVDVSAVVLSATGHQNVVHVDAVDATATENGNVEYWYCKDCGRYFLDADLTEEASAEGVVIPATGVDVDSDSEGSNSNESGLPRTGDDSNTLAAMLLGTATLALCAGLLSRRVLG